VGAAARAAAVVTIMGLALIGAAPAAAQDRSLSQDFPLRLEDAFPTATGEGTMRVSVRGVLLHRGADRVEAPVTLELGVASRTQLSISAGLSSEPHETRAGDVQVAGRYQFWVQEAVLPNLAAQLAVTAPTGVDAQAWTLEAKGLATRAVSTTLFVHFNAAAAVVDRPDDDARRLRYRLALGPSWIVPRWATLMLAADVYAAQAARRRDATTVGLEVGFRHRITAALSWHGAVGTEVAGPAARAALTVTTGLSYGFSLPGR
jgi:hypothetical protein